MPVSIQELQQQCRWVLWRLETVNGKKTKVPYQPSGRRAMANNRATWHTYADCAAVASEYSGIGLVLGDGVWGVDIDGCCDAQTGKFTPESREIVISLDSYGEYSPSGTGCHVLGLGKLTGPGIKKPHAGCKAVEVKGEGYYFTFTARHLSKTPPNLIDRQQEVTALYKRLSVSNGNGLVVSAPVDEEERFRKLWDGDMSDFDGDHSRADLALCSILARRFHKDIFKIDDELISLL
jgi:primase-polymerase (primpol)-like protein